MDGEIRSHNNRIKILEDRLLETIRQLQYQQEQITQLRKVLEKNGIKTNEYIANI